MPHSQRKRKRENRRRRWHYGPFLPHGYTTRIYWLDEVKDWPPEHVDLLLGLQGHVSRLNETDYIERYEPAGFVNPDTFEQLRSDVEWRRSNPISGIVLDSRVERPQAPADPGD